MEITPIDVIAAFNPLGEVKPIYAKVEDDEHVIHTLRITKVKDCLCKNICGQKSLLFTCDAKDMDDKESGEMTLCLRHLPFKWELVTS